MEGGEYSAAQQRTAATKIESVPFAEPLPNLRKKKNKNERRFSDEQITSLESMFKSETKLEPRKKLQLARELGLQPRQVAIWFQNRRARWKSKQIKQDYRVLKANYDNLHFRFESLKKEKQSLLIQLQKLSDLLEKPHDRGSRIKDLKANSTFGGSGSKDKNLDFKVKPSCLNKGSDQGAVAYTDDHEGRNGGNFRQEGAELLNMGGQVDGSLALPEKGCNSSVLFYQTCGSSNWWNFWS